MFVCPALLAFRIWSVGKRVSNGSMQTGSVLWPVLCIVLDAGMLYSFTLLAALVCLIAKNTVRYIVNDMVRTSRFPRSLSFSFFR
jgi:hypothetical protein